MNRFFGFLNRVFRRKPQPPRRFEYLPGSSLPIDADELVRLGVIAPRRLEAASNEQWYQVEPGVVDSFDKKLGGQADE